MNQKSQQGGVNKFVKLKGYHSYKFRKISIFILPIFCFILEKDCYSGYKDELQELYSRVKYQLENYRNPMYFNTFRSTQAYKDCLSLSFDSNDDAELERNNDKLGDCVDNFVLHANEYMQRDFSEYVSKELNALKNYGDNFKCTKDQDFHYWCENAEYKCYSLYDPSDEISPFNKGICSSIPKQGDESLETPDWFAKDTDDNKDDNTDTDATNHINSRGIYYGKW